MPTWLVKTADDEYIAWSTVVDAPTTDFMTRDEARDWLLHGREEPADVADDTLAWTDKHLCSCRARMGERSEIRNGQVVMLGGGELVYSFGSYAEVWRDLLSGNRAGPGEAEVESLAEMRARYGAPN